MRREEGAGKREERGEFPPQPLSSTRSHARSLVLRTHAIGYCLIVPKLISFLLLFCALL